MKSKLLFLLALFLWAGSSWAVTVQIGSGTSTSSNVPVYSYYGYSYTQQIYLGSEITSGGGGAGPITKIRFYYSTGTWNVNSSGWTIYMGNTSKVNFSGSTDWVPVASMTQVYSGTITTPVAGSWLEVTLTTAFDYTGGNLVIAVDENVAGYTSSSTYWGAFAPGGNRSLYAYSDSSNPNPSSPPSGSLSSNINQVQFEMAAALACSGTPDPGNTVSSANFVCPGNSFTLSLQNATPGTGVTYQWQSSPTGSDPWTNMGTASSQVTSQSVSTYYRCNVTCTSSGMTGTSNPVQVTMNQGTVPYNEGFLTTATPSCWNISGWTIGSARGVTGNPGYNIYKNLWSSAATGTFITGVVGPVASGMVLTFDYKQANYSSPYDPPVSGSGDFAVSVSTDGGSSYTVLETVTNNGIAGWQSKICPLTGYVGSNIMIKFVGNWVSGDYDLAFDNIKVEIPPACLVPTGLYSDAYTPVGADLHWSSPDSFFDIFIQLDGLPAPGPSTTPTIDDWNSGSYTWTGGSAATAYDWYIRTDCGAGGGSGQSEWSSAQSFTTQCNVYTLPFSESFAGSSIPVCWSQASTISPRWAASNTNVSGGSPYEMWANYVSGTGTSRLISPALNLAGTDPYLIFRQMYDDYGTGVTIGVQTSTDGGVNWITEWSYAGGTGNIAAESKVVHLTNYGASTLVAWWIDGNHYQYDAWYVDDVVVQDGVPVVPGLWTGNVDTDWFTEGNWDDGAIPTSLTDVVIPAGRPNYPDITNPAECNNLNVNVGGTITIQSFFDITYRIDFYGGIVIEPGATVNVTTDISQGGTGVLTINGGNLNVNGNWGGPLFGGAWAGGVLNLNGGTVDLEGAALLGTTAVNMNGPFQFYVRGNAFRMDGDFQSTPTGGTFYFEPASGITDVYIFNSDDSGVMSFFDIFLECGSSNVWLNPTWGSTSLWVRNFTVNGGNVSTISSDDLLEMSEFVIAGDMNLAADNNVNFITQTTPVTVAGEINQGLISGSGYASIMSNGNITGDYNLNIDINPLTSPGRWILISPPVAGLTADVFHCQFLQRHDPITNTWIDCIPTDPLIPGIDYALWVHADPINIPGDPICGPVIAPLTSFSWSGIMNSGAVTSPLFCDDPVNEGWNNVGNPYQATIDWDATGWTKTNVNNAIYLENNGLWASYINGSGTNGGTRYIAPGQGFFVQCNDIAGGSLTFDPSIRTLQRTAFFKNSVPELVKLEASGNGRTDETVVRFVEESTPGFDSEWDARKFHTSVNGYPEIPQLYSMDNGHMSINTLPATESVALGFKAGIENTYTIKALEINNLTKVDLEDRSTGIITNLLTDAYSFNYKPGENEQRFILHFAPLSINEAGQNVANIYSQDHTVYVDLIEYNQGNIFIYNVSGQLVANESATMGMNTLFLRNSGHYIVKVVTDEETLVKKVFIQQ